MTSILVQIFVVLALTGDPVPKAKVHCEGFAVVQDDRMVESYGQADSRGVVFVENWDPIDEPIVCHGWKEGVGKGRVTVIFDRDPKHRKYTLKLEAVDVEQAVE